MNQVQSPKKVGQTKEDSDPSLGCQYDVVDGEPCVQRCETFDVPWEPPVDWEEVRVDLDAAFVDKVRSQLYQSTAVGRTAHEEPAEGQTWEVFPDA